MNLVAVSTFKKMPSLYHLVHVSYPGHISRFSFGTGLASSGKKNLGSLPI
jgi:hypothetical protein